MGKSNRERKPAKGRKAAKKGVKKDSLVSKLRAQLRAANAKIRELTRKVLGRTEEPEDLHEPAADMTHAVELLRQGEAAVLPAGDVFEAADPLVNQVIEAAQQLPTTYQPLDAEAFAVTVGRDVDTDRFLACKPQAQFHRLPTPILEGDPDDPGRQLAWYAVGVVDGQAFLEGVRVDDAQAFARQFRAKRVRGEDTVDGGKLTDPKRGAAASDWASAALPVPVMPDDAEHVFRAPIRHERFGRLLPKDLIGFALVAEMGLHTHPVYLKVLQAGMGWTQTAADGLYPGGAGSGGLY